MKFEITARSAEISEVARRLAGEKCSKLERFFHGHTTVRAILDKVHESFRVELIASTPRRHTIVIEELHPDLLAAIDLAAGRLERHVRKTKERLYERGRHPRTDGTGAEVDGRTEGTSEEEPTYQAWVDEHRDVRRNGKRTA